MFTVPDKGEGVANLQSILWQEQLEVLVAAIDGRDCVLAGCAVSAQGSPDMTVAVAKGAVLTNGVLKPVTAGNVTVSSAHATLPRLDLIVVDSTGAKQCRAGTAAGSPKPPTRSANDVVIAMVYIPATDTTISSDQIIDQRVFRTQGPIVIDKVVSPVTFNTTSSIQTYYSLTIPNGLFLAGRTIRIRLGGTGLYNSGTPTIKPTIAYGGTTMFEDTSAAFNNSAERRTWRIELNLTAQANNDQSLQGEVFIGRQAAPAAPAVGIGDLDALGFAAIITGSAAVDSDAADRTFTYQVTMSVSNSAVETVMEYAIAELL